MNNTPASMLAEPRRWTGLKLITINLPQSYLNDLDELVGEDLYPNRAEVIRTAVRDGASGLGSHLEAFYVDPLFLG
jgi:hypothetical protein